MSLPRSDSLSPTLIKTIKFDSSLNSLTLHHTYSPPCPVFFTPGERLVGRGRITSKTHVDGIVNHLPGAIVELPVSGAHGIAIVHIFPIDPANFINPKDNIEYSLGGAKHGGQNNVECLLLRDKDTGEPVKCTKTYNTCGSTKRCSFNLSGRGVPFTSITYDTWGEVFMKTLGFFCALQAHGCAFSQLDQDFPDSDSNTDDETCFDNPSPENLVLIKKDCRSPRKVRACKGNLILCKDKYDHYFIRCEHYSRGQRNHLRLRNLGEYNVEYLVALFTADFKTILEFEWRAAGQGYGPLAPCNIMAVARAQKGLCPNWHRDSQGVLKRGDMIPAPDCPARLDVFTPHNLHQCPFVLIVSTNQHLHPQPQLTKTPAAIEAIFQSLLLPLDWRLADATPRRILLDHSFMQNLRNILGWTSDQDPRLGDLHPSLANYDHAARLIDKLREAQYPAGTGLQGAKFLLEEHSRLPINEQYLRCIETYGGSKEGTFTVVVCMFQQMSYLLSRTMRLTIDTSFKRLKNWQEFEMEAWFPEYQRSIVVARALTTSESAIAHYQLFKLIFSIVEADTGEAIRFRHIHGDGIDTITADGHRGQALGLGLYLQEICKDMHGYCSTEWTRPLYTLTPRQHVMSLYRYCLAHFARGVSKLRGHVKEPILSAMMSLASADPLPDVDTTLAFIRSGGKKAVDWLKDKQTAEGFYPLAAIYWPESRMPLDSWRAAPSTTNGNEQAHRNINRDGTSLTMLAGIMHGLQFDSRALGNIKFFTDDLIQPRDQSSTHYQRLLRGIKVKSSSQQKAVQAKDSEITKLVEKAAQIKASIDVTANSLKRSGDEKRPERDTKRLKKLMEELQETNERLSQLIPQGSGSVTVSLAPLQEQVPPIDEASIKSYITGEIQWPESGPSPQASTAPPQTKPEPGCSNAVSTAQCDYSQYPSPDNFNVSHENTPLYGYSQHNSSHSQNNSLNDYYPRTNASYFQGGSFTDPQNVSFHNYPSDNFSNDGPSYYHPYYTSFFPPSAHDSTAFDFTSTFPPNN